jgi:peptidoglycan/xylan/chitin deacetylase (PgdA/CDA1 family)
MAAPQNPPNRGETATDPIPQGVLALTFDDGPTREYTANIADAVARQGVPATFFVLGRKIPGNRDILDYVRSRGHQIANHTYYHFDATTQPESLFKAHVVATKINIGDRDFGRLLFRFPYGSAGDEQMRWIQEIRFDRKSYKAVGWNVDSFDWSFGQEYPRREFSGFLQNNVEFQCQGQVNPFTGDYIGWTQFIARLRGGGIMLFHDHLRITHDKIDLVLTYLRSAQAYWDNLPAPTRNAYLEYYRCLNADPNLSFQILPLHAGPWPSLVD